MAHDNKKKKKEEGIDQSPAKVQKDSAKVVKPTEDKEPEKSEDQKDQEWYKFKNNLKRQRKRKFSGLWSRLDKRKDK